MPLFWTFIFAVVAFVAFCIYLYRMQFAYRNMPPGPVVLPFVGSALWFFFRKPIYNPRDVVTIEGHKYLHLGYKKFGGMFSGTLGKYTGVIISSYEIFKEIEHMEEFSMKVCNELTTPRTMGEELGIIFAMNPKLWVEMRKFSQRTLREYGFGKRHTMQSVIEAEINETMKGFRKEMSRNDGIVTIRTTFNLSVLNVLWCMIAGQRYEHDDPKLLKMMNNNFAMTKSVTFIDPILVVFPLLKTWFPKLFKSDLVNECFEETHKFSRTLIEERRAEEEYLESPQNYIDCFLKKIIEHKDDPGSVYNEKNLQIMVEDFLQVGSTTSVGTLNYAVLFLTLNPQVQKKCQVEIDSIVPRHLIPTLDDIEKMPYFQATILETHRRANVVPIPVPRVVPKDWKYRGYDIAKGTILVSNHYSVHMDEDYWGDPEAFRPDRFINENGKFFPDKHVIHFGFGKRNCLGITLANSVIPIYVATLLQNFNFSVVPGSQPLTTNPEMGISLSPKEFSVQLTSRKVL